MLMCQYCALLSSLLVFLGLFHTSISGSENDQKDFFDELFSPSSPKYMPESLSPSASSDGNNQNSSDGEGDANKLLNSSTTASAQSSRKRQFIDDSGVNSKASKKSTEAQTKQTGSWNIIGSSTANISLMPKLSVVSREEISVQKAAGDEKPANSLRMIKHDQNFVELIHLKIVFADDILEIKATDGRLHKKQILIGTDGTDFVNVVAFGNENVDKMQNSFGLIGNTTMSRNFALKYFRVFFHEDYNFGSVPFELQIDEQSKIEVYTTKQWMNLRNVNADAYFQFLWTNKQVTQRFTATHSQLQPVAGRKIDLTARFVELKNNIVRVQTMHSHVANVTMIVGNKKVSLCAWNILGQFIVNNLKEVKKGTIIQLQDVEFMKRQGRTIINMIFVNESRISIPSTTSTALRPMESAPANTVELSSKDKTGATSMLALTTKTLPSTLPTITSVAADQHRTK